MKVVEVGEAKALGREGSSSNTEEGSVVGEIPELFNKMPHPGHLCHGPGRPIHLPPILRTVPILQAAPNTEAYLFLFFFGQAGEIESLNFPDPCPAFSISPHQG